MRLVLYTTRYRGGGRGFERAARTMGDRFEAAGFAARTVRVESKADVRAALASLGADGTRVEQLHFVGHGGMYGPMFGSTAWPEQFSPHEWRTLRIPWAEDAEAFFHCCRSARWFAPFFARTCGVPAHGYHWYTTFSRVPDRFVWPRPGLDDAGPLYVFGCPGKKSHGWSASLRKWSGRMRAEPLRRFTPPDAQHTDGYDAVAEMYDRTFDDIGVRHDEITWLESRWGPGSLGRVLDLGCGNGALLERLRDRIEHGVGVDASEAMIHRARRRLEGPYELHHVRGPELPVADRSIDLAVSLLSFRYLDWDPILAELQRVLRPEGRLLIVDMVEKPAPLPAWPRVLRDRARARRFASPSFRRELDHMVRSDAWATMLRYNPMRALHEYEWFLPSRFPRGTFETLNVGRRARVVAFDSGPMRDARLRPMAYP